MSRLFMPLLLELDGLEVAINMSRLMALSEGIAAASQDRAEARPSVGNRIRSRNFRQLTRPRAMR
jgi:hypothetical protein